MAQNLIFASEVATNTPASGASTQTFAFNKDRIASSATIPMGFDARVSVALGDTNWGNRFWEITYQYFSSAVPTYTVTRDTIPGSSDLAGTINMRQHHVDWHEAFTKIQTGAVTLGSTVSSVDSTITPVNLSNTFADHYMRVGTSTAVANRASNVDDASMHFTMVSFPSSASIRVERSASGSSLGLLTGTYYIVESLSSDFSVQTVTPTLNSTVKTVTSTMSEVVESKTFLVGSFMTNTTTDHPNELGVNFELASTAGITLSRGNASAPNSQVDATIFAVTCPDNQWNVQRFKSTLTSTQQEAEHEVTPFIKRQRGFASAPSAANTFYVGSNNSTDNTNIDNNMLRVSLEFVPNLNKSTNIFIDRGTVSTAGRVNIEYSVEVVDFAVGEYPSYKMPVFRNPLVRR